MNSVGEVLLLKMGKVRKLQLFNPAGIAMPTQIKQILVVYL